MVERAAPHPKTHPLGDRARDGIEEAEMLDVAALFYVLEKIIGFAFLGAFALLMAVIGICSLIEKRRAKKAAK